MATADNINRQQLAMLVQVKDLLDRTKFEPIEFQTYRDRHREKVADTGEGVKYYKHKHMWAEKLNKSHGLAAASDAIGGGRHEMTPLHDRIKAEGIRTPIDVIKGWVDRTIPKAPDGYPVDVIINGHHRAAIANDIDPNMEVPIIYGR